jgi:putative nucleotidyltransferase with HDIG domain
MEKIMEQLKEHDPDTYYHSLRVAYLSLTIAKAMGCSKAEQDIVYYGALYHDIGKLRISKEILNKPGQLTADEWLLIQQHPIFGYEILSDSNVFKYEIIYTVLFHHERFNGSGYPFSLRGKEIPLNAQIVSIADTFDAMINHRVYSKAKSETEAIDELMSEKGILFSDQLVDKLTQVLFARG